MTHLSMRNLLLSLTALGTVFVAANGADARPAKRAAAAATPALAPIDLTTPAGVLAANRKMGCDLRDGVAVTYYWAGDAYSRRQGEADKLLFRAEGMNIRHCVSINDPVRGAGYRLISRELLIYTDPRTGKVLSKWTNPFTNEVVDVLHVANDPVNSSSFVTGRDGQPIRWTGTTIGDVWWTNTTVPLFYSNPLAGKYQAEIGGTYHATEMFNFSGSLSDLIDPTKTTAEARVAWVRISDWLPWMRMGGREGVIYFNTNGRKLDKFEDLPAVMKDEIAKSYPNWTSPPPLDDARPNETSWSYFLDIKEGRKVAPKRD
jgi:Protein of unknown function (DUF1838)